MVQMWFNILLKIKPLSNQESGVTKTETQKVWVAQIQKAEKEERLSERRIIV